jgi:methylmalonyl-CoA epimerase
MNTDLFVCIDHVGLAVPNLDEAIKFHTEVMGWRVLHRETNEEQGVEEAMLGTGEQGAENAQIQLLAPLNENSTIAKFIAKNGQGIQQLAYRVKDIDAVSEALPGAQDRYGRFADPVRPPQGHRRHPARDRRASRSLILSVRYAGRENRYEVAFVKTPPVRHEERPS